MSKAAIGAVVVGIASCGLLQYQAKTVENDDDDVGGTYELLMSVGERDAEWAADATIRRSPPSHASPEEQQRVRARIIEVYLEEDQDYQGHKQALADARKDLATGVGTLRIFSFALLVLFLAYAGFLWRQLKRKQGGEVTRRLTILASAAVPVVALGLHVLSAAVAF